MNEANSEPSAKDLFLDALELEGSAREAFIEKRTAGDSDLRAQVLALLKSHVEWSDGSSAGYTSLGGVAELPSTDALFGGGPQDAQPGQTVGPFTLEREIGRGGFGTVWLASQTVPVSRQVALKMLRAGLDTHEITTRFLAERQALALMDHTNIARIFDGGATDSGSPWFSMEYVDGVPITQYCSNHGLSLDQRLGLFIETCRAVEHAHQKSIIHRDIKPNNVLVTDAGGRATPKVIDFGIAKAIEQSLTPEPLATRSGQTIGTPASMSPEQFGGASDVDTRADVYALGGLLYEILTGFQPFSTASGQIPPVEKLLEIVRHEDPVIPSARIASGERSAGLRSKQVKGDLDWIIMRCMEKDRDRRYGSVALLINDIERHLVGETVSAGPPTLSYRLSKLTKRYKGALGVGLVIFMLLVGGIVASTLQANRAVRAEGAAKEEARRANVELERFESIATLLEHMLSSISPEQAKGKDPELLLDILERAHAHVDEQQPSPVVEASIRRVIGDAYSSLAKYDLAEAQLVRALEIRETELEPNDPQLLGSLEELGVMYVASGQFEKGLPFIERAYAGQLELRGPDHLDTIHAKVNLSTTRMRMAHYEQAVVELEELELWHMERLGPEDSATLLVMNNLALCLQNLGRADEAVDRLQRLVELQTEFHGPDGATTLRALGNLGSQYSEMGRLEDALSILEKTLVSKRRVMQAGHPSRLVAYSNLARLHRMLKQLDQAEKLFDEALAEGIKALGPDQRHVLILRFNMASLYMETDRKELARTTLEELLPTVVASEAADSPFLKAVRSQLAIAKE